MILMSYYFFLLYGSFPHRLDIVIELADYPLVHTLETVLIGTLLLLLFAFIATPQYGNSAVLRIAMPGAFHPALISDAFYRAVPPAR